LNIKLEYLIVIHLYGLMTRMVTNESSNGLAANQSCVSQINVVEERGRTRRRAEDRARKAGTCLGREL